ncbi:DUF4145 domain-containing protein [Aurantimonas coralicida]|uniref:DUF4145 domain-containing protein n=1 Tax=Aurantimonas coralicida TaxID=182270 RepID=UPI001D18141F|nr:DUF4145 domain-containing protein [Aurantimonas coralicida]MCC4298325.1 DUF4145 domain-containing protein [Aurantimonas coralicida]
MAFRRSLWAEAFPIGKLPKFPCPTCDDGRLIADKDSFFLGEPRYSKAAQGHDDWEPDWDVGRFSQRLICDHDECGEIVIVHGQTALVQEYDEEFGWSFVSVLQPNSLSPAPRMINLPKNLPWSVIKQLRQVFALFWVDIGSAGNRLRTSLEGVLDDLQVPRQVIDQKKGKMVDLDLNGRIQHLEKQSPDQAQTFHALRMIGNIGSHTVALSREALLDAFELYEDALADIYSNRKAYLDEIKKKIIKTKGKY